MLSNMLHEHPEVLSLSEFFAMLEPPLAPEGVLEASDFWNILSSPNQRLRMIWRPNIRIPEILYPYSPTSRFTYETGVPPILLVPLPHLTTDFEALYDELQAVVAQFPPAPIAGHYARLFAWLSQHFGRRVCIERSGLSLPLLPELLKVFPQTKMVHLVRDGRGCVWSMYRHAGFRLAAYYEDVAACQEESDTA